jgi:hypothetical protein
MELSTEGFVPSWRGGAFRNPTDDLNVASAIL